eukprot:6639341-Prorocentrum_lima.AAC.1
MAEAGITEAAITVTVVYRVDAVSQTFTAQNCARYTAPVPGLAYDYAIACETANGIGMDLQAIATIS